MARRKSTTPDWRDKLIAAAQTIGKAPTRVRLATQNVLHGGEVLIVGITEFANVTERFVADLRKANDVLTMAVSAGQQEYHEQFGESGKRTASAEFHFAHDPDTAEKLMEVLSQRPEQFGEALAGVFKEVFEAAMEEGPLPDEPVDGNHFAVDDPNYPDRRPEDPNQALYMKVTEEGGGSTVLFGPLSSAESYRIEHSQYGVHLQEDGYSLTFLGLSQTEALHFDADLFGMETWEREERQYLDRLARDGEQGMGRLDLPTTGIEDLQK